MRSLSHTHYWYEVGMLKVPAKYSGEYDAAIAKPVHRYFQHAHFIPMVGVEKRGAY